MPPAQIDKNEILNYDNLLTTALGITIALSWNAAAKESIDAAYPIKNVSSARAHILYAVVITIIAILVLYAYIFVKAIANGAVAHFETFATRRTAKRSEATHTKC